MLALYFLLAKTKIQEKFTIVFHESGEYKLTIRMYAQLKAKFDSFLHPGNGFRTRNCMAISRHKRRALEIFNPVSSEGMWVYSGLVRCNNAYCFPIIGDFNLHTSSIVQNNVYVEM